MYHLSSDYHVCSIALDRVLNRLSELERKVLGSGGGDAVVLIKEEEKDDDFELFGSDDDEVNIFSSAVKPQSDC